MMLTIVGVQSALLATMAACRKRAAVLKTLTIRSRESAPVRVLARVLSERALSTTTMERMVAAKAVTLIRGFVHTTAFDQVVLSAVAHIRARVKKGGM
jgi:PIN domain nuclease of toxin-antitoxin system